MELFFCYSNMKLLTGLQQQTRTSNRRTAELHNFFYNVYMYIGTSSYDHTCAGNSFRTMILNCILKLGVFHVIMRCIRSHLKCTNMIAPIVQNYPVSLTLTIE